MRFIDTHAHLYLPRFDADRKAALQRAVEAGIEAVFLPNIDRGSIEQLHRLAGEHPNSCFPMMGIHPCSIKADWEVELEAARQLLFQSNQEEQVLRYIAVGEIGLDYYWDRSFVDQQKEAYRMQIAWAIELDLPIVVHSRDSLHDSIGIAEEMASANPNQRLRGVFHCFNGTVEQGRRIRELGCCLGIGGVVTYKNAGVAEVMAELGPEGVVLETDSPYLAPVPFRGKRNESAYIPLVAEKLADCWNISVNQVAQRTTETAVALFPAAELTPA